MERRRKRGGDKEMREQGKGKGRGNSRRGEERKREGSTLSFGGRDGGMKWSR